jgi:hypothetical protein
LPSCSLVHTRTRPPSNPTPPRPLRPQESSEAKVAQLATLLGLGEEEAADLKKTGPSGKGGNAGAGQAAEEEAFF